MFLNSQVLAASYDGNIECRRLSEYELIKLCRLMLRMGKGTYIPDPIEGPVPDAGVEVRRRSQNSLLQ
jgi:hypothetical protein